MCSFLAFGILLCVGYNGLYQLTDRALTIPTIELELKNINPMGNTVPYDQSKWVSLKRLWVNRVAYTCQEGVCHRSFTAPPRKSTAPPQYPHQVTVTRKLSDVGIILIVLGSVVIGAVCYVVAVCMEWRRRCSSWICTKYRRCRGLPIEEDDEQDEMENQSMLVNLGRRLRERLSMQEAPNQATPSAPHPQTSTPNIQGHPGYAQREGNPELYMSACGDNRDMSSCITFKKRD